MLPGSFSIAYEFSESSGDLDPALLPESFAERVSEIQPGQGENRPVDIAVADSLWCALLDALPQGVLVLTRNLRLLYQNAIAKDILRVLEKDCPANRLPGAIVEACCHLVKQPSPENRSVLIEWQTSEKQLLRIRTRWLVSRSGHSSFATHHLIMLLLENGELTGQEEILIDRQKYELTDREAEIWRLLRQDYTYQEMAATLQISLNTVKTHVKNVYAKRRSYQGKHTVVIL